MATFRRYPRTLSEADWPLPKLMYQSHSRLMRNNEIRRAYIEAQTYAQQIIYKPEGERLKNFERMEAELEDFEDEIEDLYLI